MSSAEEESDHLSKQQSILKQENLTPKKTQGYMNFKQDLIEILKDNKDFKIDPQIEKQFQMALKLEHQINSSNQECSPNVQQVHVEQQLFSGNKNNHNNNNKNDHNYQKHYKERTRVYQKILQYVDNKDSNALKNNQKYQISVGSQIQTNIFEPPQCNPLSPKLFEQNLKHQQRGQNQKQTNKYQFQQFPTKNSSMKILKQRQLFHNLPFLLNLNQQQVQHVNPIYQYPPLTTRAEQRPLLNIDQNQNNQSQMGNISEKKNANDNSQNQMLNYKSQESQTFYKPEIKQKDLILKKYQILANQHLKTEEKEKEQIQLEERGERKLIFVNRQHQHLRTQIQQENYKDEQQIGSQLINRSQNAALTVIGTSSSSSLINKRSGSDEPRVSAKKLTKKEPISFRNMTDLKQSVILEQIQKKKLKLQNKLFKKQKKMAKKRLQFEKVRAETFFILQKNDRNLNMTNNDHYGETIHDLATKLPSSQSGAVSLSRSQSSAFEDGPHNVKKFKVTQKQTYKGNNEKINNKYISTLEQNKCSKEDESETSDNFSVSQFAGSPKQQHHSQTTQYAGLGLFIKSEQQKKPTKFILPNPVIQVQAQKSKEEIEPIQNYTFSIVEGNNSELVRKILKNKVYWMESYSFASHFRWQPCSNGYRFEKLRIFHDPSPAKLCMTNHLEFHELITNKQKLIESMESYCKKTGDHVFNHMPLSFYLDFDSTNIVNAMCEFKQFFKHKSSQLPASFNNGVNLWLIKPIDMNRGRGIMLFNDLAKFDQIVEEIKQTSHGNKKEQQLQQFQSRSKSPHYTTIQQQPLSRARTPSNAKLEDKHILSRTFYGGESIKESKIAQLQKEEVEKEKEKEMAKTQESFAQKIQQKVQGAYKGSFVVQKYVERPLLIYERKFDIRCWVLLTHDLQLYQFSQGYIRTSSEKFDMQENMLQNVYIHLTNNAIQKFNKNYGKFENGNQISFQEFENILKEQGHQHQYKHILSRIKKLIKISIQSIITKINKNNRKFCFEIFGYDFIVDADFQVWLIEVNTNPCIELSSPLLEKMIPRMLSDAFSLTLDVIFPPLLLTKEKKLLYQAKNCYPMDGVSNHNENQWVKIHI